MLVLTISAISFPLLLDRDVGAAVALFTSIRVVAANPLTMALWGFIVAAALLIGSIPFFLGLTVVMPVLGHATWHLYRRAVEPDADPHPDYQPRQRPPPLRRGFPGGAVSDAAIVEDATHRRFVSRRQRLIIAGTAITCAFPHDLGLSFLGSVARDPGALAIVDGDVHLSYAEWYRRISALVAWILTQSGSRSATISSPR